MKRILVLGGNRFFGKKLIELLLDENHQVTILTRGQSGNPFGGKVEHLVADRTDRSALANAVKGREFDLVYDNICYSPNEAKAFCEIFNGKIGKLVFTSSLAVYEPDGKVKHEKNFNPLEHEVKMGGAGDFSYAEGKRQAEAVLFREAAFPVAAVRFPVVLGVEDYTRRLHFHVERSAKGAPIAFVNMDAEMSFIHAGEAAAFLKWAGFSQANGPYNATANGRISLASLMELIARETGSKADIVFEGSDEIRSPNAVPHSWYMSNEKAEREGFQFTRLEDWLPQLIGRIAAETE